MSPSLIIYGVSLAVALTLLGVFFGYRQLRLLRQLRGKTDLPQEEAVYQRGQAKRRLVSCLLMLVLAAMIGGQLVYLQDRVERIVQEGDAIRDAGGKVTSYSDADRSFIRAWIVYLIVFHLILLVVVGLAAVDFWSIRRYGRQQYRRLQEDRRDMIERQVIRMRQERNSLN